MKTRLLLALLIVGVVPTPSVAQAPQQPVYDFGWFSDDRRFQVGDVLTILIDEYTLASADRSTFASEDRSTDVALSGRTGTTLQGGVLGTLLANESGQRGRDTRQDRITSELSVRVTQVEESGTLQVEGTKRLVIDDHEQEVTIRGFVRTQDITAANTIDSWRVANAEVLYATEGELGKPKKGILSRIFGFIIP